MFSERMVAGDERSAHVRNKKYCDDDVRAR